MVSRSVIGVGVGVLMTGALIAPTASANPATTPASATPASAANPRTADPRTADPRTVDTRTADARTVDTRAEDPKVTFLVGLPRDRSALDKAATERSTPGELTYRDHPSVTSAGKTYGASSKSVTRLRTAAQKLGVGVSVDKGRILARLTAPVSVWNKAYGLKMRTTTPTPTFPYRTFSMLDGTAYAKAPASLRAVTVEWVPTYSEYVASADVPGISEASFDDLEELLASTGTPNPWPRNLGTVPADTCDAPAVKAKAVYVPAQIQAAYGTTALAAKGVRGQDARLTVISAGGGYAAQDLADAAECFGYTAPRINVVRGTGVPQPFVNASSETHLDLITASAALPRTSSITLLQVVEGLTGFTDAFARMLDGPSVPDVASLSYGVCEAEYDALYGDYLTLNEDLLRLAAIVGTSVIVASGDYGSSMCGAQIAEESGEPTVWYPASSAWVTAVGGTRLALKPDNTRRTERVWNDLPYVGGTTPPGPAGSGGPSILINRPWWQAGVTPVGPRTVPDVALLGAIRPGWPIVYGGEVFTVGGTSGGAPFLAANLAAMSAAQRGRGFPTIGFANAWLYSAAAAKTSPFFDVVAGSNAVQVVGCCSAYPGYDMASGLGVPVMDRLYATLPRPAG